MLQQNVTAKTEMCVITSKVHMCTVQCMCSLASSAYGANLLLLNVHLHGLHEDLACLRRRRLFSSLHSFGCVLFAHSVREWQNAIFINGYNTHEHTPSIYGVSLSVCASLKRLWYHFRLLHWLAMLYFTLVARTRPSKRNNSKMPTGLKFIRTQTASSLVIK